MLRDSGRAFLTGKTFLDSAHEFQVYEQPSNKAEQRDRRIAWPKSSQYKLPSCRPLSLAKGKIARPTSRCRFAGGSIHSSNAHSGAAIIATVLLRQLMFALLDYGVSKAVLLSNDAAKESLHDAEHKFE